VPAWSFATNELNLNLEGYATVWGTTFRVKDVPVLYTPFFILPAKTKRQTGFLTPQPGSSSLDGFTLDVPFFWAISENSDATFYAGLKTMRGIMEGLEYRYVLDNQSFGAFMVSYLDDSLSDSRFREVDNTPRTNTERWWLRGKANQVLPAGFLLLADLDLVSDGDYLREFTSGYQDFYPTNAYFNTVFRRSLQEQTDQIRESSVVASRQEGYHYLSGEMRYFQDLQPGREDTAQPTLRYSATEHPLLDSPLYWQLASRYDYFLRRGGDSPAPSGQRLSLQPRLRLPFFVGHVLSVIPTAAVRETLFLAQEDEQGGRDISGLKNREDYSVGGTVSTQLSRVFQVGSPGLSAVKHIMRPELSYVYEPEPPDQDELPLFEPNDRLSTLNLATLSLTHELIGKVRDGDHFSYPRLARARLAQGLDLDSLEDEPGKPARPFRPLLAEAEAAFQGFYFKADAQWDWHETGFASYGILSSWRHPDGHAVSIDYQFLRRVAEDISLAATVKVRNDLKLYTIQRSSLRAAQVVESTVGFVYQAQCWAADLSYTRDPFSQQVMLRITLAGIGDLGSFAFSSPTGAGGQ
jgi:LPS-assembly protein